MMLLSYLARDNSKIHHFHYLENVEAQEKAGGRKALGMALTDRFSALGTASIFVFVHESRPRDPCQLPQIPRYLKNASGSLLQPSEVGAGT